MIFEGTNEKPLVGHVRIIKSYRGFIVRLTDPTFRSRPRAVAVAMDNTDIVCKLKGWISIKGKNRT